MEALRSKGHVLFGALKITIEAWTECLALGLPGELSRPLKNDFLAPPPRPTQREEWIWGTPPDPRPFDSAALAQDRLQGFAPSALPFERMYRAMSLGVGV
jgi:hypothetical protein